MSYSVIVKRLGEYHTVHDVHFTASVETRQLFCIVLLLTQWTQTLRGNLLYYSSYWYRLMEPYQSLNPCAIFRILSSMLQTQLVRMVQRCTVKNNVGDGRTVMLKTDGQIVR
jgi:hypothetical protein